MKKNQIQIATLLCSSFFLFFSCSEELNKADFDYVQDPSKIASIVTLDLLEQASEEEIQIRAVITPSADKVYDQGLMYSSSEDFAQYTIISIQPDTTDAGIIMKRDAFPLMQGVTFYFKAFVLTKDGLVLSKEMKSILLPITWETVGKVLFTDPIWSGKEGIITIQKFFGRNEYRLVDIFHILDDANAKVPAGKPLRFFLDDNGNAIGFPKGMQDVFCEPYTFYWDSAEYPQYCYFTNKANVYAIGYILAENGVPTYIGSGSFEWTDGYPGSLPKP
ncbi:MAG: hypothetical protein FWF52_09685 [Candidatus Azobacteroides sp.]|nr:hypothetical protein [Candidatus Azobacteroides sp.]